MNKKLFIIIITIFPFLFLTGCFRIPPTIPDLTPPTGVSIDTSAALDVAPQLTISWYLIPDISSLVEYGVNIYYAKNGDSFIINEGQENEQTVIINNESLAYEFFLLKWAAHIDESNDTINTEVEGSIIKNSSNTIPTVSGTAAYSSLGESKQYTIIPSDIGYTTSFENNNFYFIMTSWGKWGNDNIPVESPLSNMVIAVIGSAK